MSSQLWVAIIGAAGIIIAALITILPKIREQNSGGGKGTTSEATAKQPKSKKMIKITIVLSSIIILALIGVALHFASQIPTISHNTGKGVTLETKPNIQHQVSINEQKLYLESPSWGKFIANATGKVRYVSSMKNGFQVTIQLENLESNHSYVLSINGKPGQAGNDKLPDRFNSEGKFDFKQIRTDANGNYSGQISSLLPPGDYNVKFFVKDPATDWKIVLYNDFLTFTIEDNDNIPDKKEKKLLLDNFESIDSSKTYVSYQGETVINSFGYGIYYDQADCKLSLVPISNTHKALCIYYTLPPLYSWGNWISIRKNFSSPMDLTNYIGLELVVREEKPSLAKLRITLADVDTAYKVKIQGADELWWYDIKKGKTDIVPGTQTFFLPFEDFSLSHGKGTRQNNMKLDLNRIVGFEINLVSNSNELVKGTVCIDSLYAVGEKP